MQSGNGELKRSVAEETIGPQFFTLQFQLSTIHSHHTFNILQDAWLAAQKMIPGDFSTPR